VVRKGSAASWVGDHTQTTLWQIDKNLKSETGHGTQKPVECMRRPIENNASPGQGVYEPFSGSGTTIIAAEMTGRVCHAIEIAPANLSCPATAVRKRLGLAPASVDLSFGLANERRAASGNITLAFQSHP
jgi:hypothetical protein